MDTAALPTETAPETRSSEQLVIRRASRSTFILIAVGVAMAGGGAWLVANGQPVAGWGITALFGLLAVIAFVTVLPGSTQIELDREGFTMVTLFQPGERVRWEEVDRFETVEVAGRRRAGYRLRSSAASAKERSGTPAPHAGLDGVFMRDFGMGPKQLVDTLRDWRRRHVA